MKKIYNNIGNYLKTNRKKYGRLIILLLLLKGIGWMVVAYLIAR